MNHSINQSDYALWKAKLIDKICIEKNINKKCTYSKTRKFSKKHNKTYNGIYVKFSWAKYFRFLRRKTYINIPEDRDLKNVKYILSQLYSPLHIAIWFLDDSSEKRKKRKRNRSTSPFPFCPAMMKRWTMRWETPSKRTRSSTGTGRRSRSGISRSVTRSSLHDRDQHDEQNAHRNHGPDNPNEAVDLFQPARRLGSVFLHHDLLLAMIFYFCFR